MEQLTIETISLTASVRDKIIIKNVSLKCNNGEVLAIMGPNGSGKTSLANVIMGHPRYEVISGKIYINGEDVTNLSAHERSLRGLMLLFQSPPEIPGVRLSNIILSSYNKKIGKEVELLKVHRPEVIKEMNEATSEVGLSTDFLYRELNVGFSGGERKRAELLQALVLKPINIIMDEPDSGLDVDGLKIVSNIIKRMKEEDRAVILITHYTRLFKYVEPEKVMLLFNGEKIAEGGSELAKQVDELGYKKFAEKLGITAGDLNE
ncbi:Fe-S cluster assembly ATPase SufC [Fervidicoccus fontis]|uniref:Fe-S cluster assembly ATPase SufC n=1 Tax=Fervidicoccus fontis TaxID=683846 RepID=A0A843A9G1_9CREN|nr:Fe-S cluster assembly ATPase SufC [Fervidicoccus fontis]MBE9391325.1 Fe-S cluster assembly ATPase SufC [Fervidicoccus fontis]